METVLVSSLRAKLKEINNYAEKFSDDIVGLYHSEVADLVAEMNDVNTDDFIGRGAFRSAYLTKCGNMVVKFPLHQEGAIQNIMESRRFDVLAPYGLAPKHKLIWVNISGGLVPLLYVEKLTSMDADDHVGELRNCAERKVLERLHVNLGFADWLQTGVTQGYRRVFSDLGH